MHKVDALIVFDANNNNKTYLEYKEKCFDTLADNKLNIVTSDFVAGSIVCARKNALHKSKAPYICIIDPDDYIGDNYAEQMLDVYEENTIIYPNEYQIWGDKITTTPYINKEPTVENIKKWPAIGHHQFSSSKTIRNVYNLINIKTLQDTRTFFKYAMQLGLNYKQSQAEYYWRIYKGQTSCSIEFRMDYAFNNDKYDV